MASTSRRRVFRLPLARQVRTDVDAELRFHLEERVEELMDQGMSRPEAEAVAAERFGDVTRVREELVSIDRAGARRQDRGEWIAGLARDARVAIRGFRRSPGFVLAAVLTLALGIGANAAIFSAVNAVLLRPLPVKDLDRLLVVRSDLVKLGLMNTELSPGESDDLLRRTDLFESATAYVGRKPTLAGIGEPRKLAGVRTLGRFFDVFEVRPQLGRFYRPDESEEGAAPVAVLSDALWRELSGGDPSFVGKSIRVDGELVEVVGVAPPRFRHPRSAEIYLPFTMTARARSPEQRASLYMTFVGKVKRGITPEKLASGFADERQKWREAHPDTYSDDPNAYRLHATPLVTVMAGQLRLILAVLMGAVVLVLLIACANVASLQLVRASGRAKELAVRTALGAGRAAIVQQLLVESLILAIAGGALGLLLGELTVGLLGRLAPTQFPQLTGVWLDGHVLGFVATVAVASGVAFGLLPALRASRTDLNDVMKDGAGKGGSAGLGRHRLLQGSVVIQVALALVLLMGSALVTRSLVRLLAVDPGFRAEHVYTVKVQPPPGSKYQGTTLPDFYREVVQRVAAIPGVEAAGAAFGLPFSGDLDSTPFDIPGMPRGENEPMRHAEYRVVTGDYFRSMGIAIKRGRALGAADVQGAPHAVVIDETLADQYFRGQDPVGRVLKQLGSPSGDLWTVVGVATNVMRGELGEAPKATVYYSHAQVPWYSGLAVTVRSALDEGQVARAVRAAVQALEPGAVLYDAHTMRERVDQSLGGRRLAVAVLTGFAGLSLVLAVLGLYGVISYGMAQRTREIGIRLALGAQGGDVVRMVLVQGLVLALAGLAAGAVLFVGLGRVLASLLYGIGARDPLTLTACAALLVATAALAAWLPARRAAAVDPAIALRES
ncbi:MAG: ADOP family duplicated permease [Gemmatimonadaceae bacterium]